MAGSRLVALPSVWALALGLMPMQAAATPRAALGQVTIHHKQKPLPTPPPSVVQVEMSILAVQPRIGSGAVRSRFRNTFGQAPLLSLGGTWQALHGWAGVLGAHVRVGQWQVSGKDDARFVVYPMTVAAVYRADFLERLYDFPLSPYLRVGVDTFVWDADNYAFVPERTTGTRGATVGVHGAAGVTWRYRDLQHHFQGRPLALVLRLEGSFGWANNFQRTNNNPNQLDFSAVTLGGTFGVEW